MSNPYDRLPSDWKRLREEKRRDNDLAFLARVRALRDARDLDALIAIEFELLSAIERAQKQGRNGPDWMLVVITRAMDHIVNDDSQ